jgi:hypothetical protein
MNKSKWAKFSMAFLCAMTFGYVAANHMADTENA